MFSLSFIRPNIAAAVLAAALFGAAVTVSWSAPQIAYAADKVSILGTPDQPEADKRRLALLADPEVVQLQNSLMREISGWPTAQSPDEAATLRHAISLWTGSLIMSEQGGAEFAPKIIWGTDNTPHSWFGLSLPGAGAAGDNPDHIYRAAYLQGGAAYEITGQVDLKARPSQFSFQLNYGSPGKIVSRPQNSTQGGLGNHIATLTDRDIQIDPQGRFRITIGGAPGGDNHIETTTGDISLLIRDVLGDWRQRPNRLTIRRVDGPAGPNIADAELRSRVLRDLPNHVRFWAHFRDQWFGGLEENTFAAPVPREGNWGAIAGARFKLAPDEALILTTEKSDAAYVGIQLIDPWMISAPADKYQLSLNRGQVSQNADGSLTYVVSARDPGLANWLDTAGRSEGLLVLRWQGFAAGVTPFAKIRDFRVVKIADLDRLLPDAARVTPKARAAALAQRAVEYRNRLGGPAEVAIH